MMTDTPLLPATGQPTVALIGAGAVGLALVATLAHAGWGVTVCGARTPFDRLCLSEGRQTATYPVRHARTPEELGACTVVVLAVKAHQTADVAHWLHAVNRPDVRVLVAQNGLEQRERLALHAPMAVGLPTVVYFNAERLAPGWTVLRRIGAVDVCLPQGAGVQDVVMAMQQGGMRVTTAADMTTVVWTKLLANSAANPLTALSGRHTGVMREPEMIANARQIMTEVVQVGQAEGASLTAQNVEETIAWFQTIPPDSTTSMLQDRLAGRPLEYDAITGALVRAADRHGLGVPLNRFVLGLLSAIKPMQTS
ncbi:ketopantoate reductase family protein [Acetobacter ghanensis]|uniref:2-dehydropantoate 2-reductase n=2 Tax=Acetobacter ghanensis TaxID=431306 RepID=A0A0U5F3G7_9PROT|nr:2-dehydropantoate 2-reductase [Acetobacter ghanensis]CEF54361.1 2-dehydropantoate 2-reductase [Acetobacter ghanensis]